MINSNADLPMVVITIPEDRPKALPAVDAYIQRGISLILSALDVTHHGMPVKACQFHWKRGIDVKAESISVAGSSKPQIPDHLPQAALFALLRLSHPLFDREPVGSVDARWIGNGASPNVSVTAGASSGEHRFQFGLPDESMYERPPETLPPESDHALLARFGAAWLSDILDAVNMSDLEGRAFDSLSVSTAGASWRVNNHHSFRSDGPHAPELGSRTEKRAGHGIRVQPLQSIAATEPRILVLSRHWGLFAQWMRYQDAAGPLSLIGFELARNADWVVDSHSHPSEVYEYLARVCNVSCKFCYLYGNPSDLAIARGEKVASRSELDTRLAYYDPAEKKALFKAQWEINEFLVDPNIGPVIRELRSRSHLPFFFVTNGNPLDERMVDLLAEVAPVDLIVSVNTTDTVLRRQMMNERANQTARAEQALHLLRDRQIPFGVSLAAFPELTRAHFLDAIEAASESRAAFVRVNLPGHTKQLPPNPPFNSAKRWKEVIEWVRETRTRVEVPIISIPSAYEMNHFGPQRRGAEIWGVIPDSEAARSGLRPYDVIVEFGGFPIRTRSELISLAMLIRAPVKVVYERDGAMATCLIEKIEPTYPALRPVFGKYLFPLGLVAAPSLGPVDAEELGNLLSGSVNPAIVSSPLMLPAARKLVGEFLPEYAATINWITGRNDYLGGNIQVLDMATVGDLVHAIEAALANGTPCDRIIIPGSGFNRQGRDIAGRHWSDIERCLRIPVYLLNCQQFLF